MISGDSERLSKQSTKVSAFDHHRRAFLVKVAAQLRNGTTLIGSMEQKPYKGRGLGGMFLLD